MNNLHRLVLAVIGRKQTIRARVFRAATQQWEDHGIVSETRVGGLIPAIRELIKGVFYGKQSQNQSR